MNVLKYFILVLALLISHSSSGMNDIEIYRSEIIKEIKNIESGNIINESVAIAEIVNAWMQHSNLENVDQLVFNLCQFLSDLCDVISEGDFSIKQKGVFLGSVLAGGLKYAKEKGEKDVNIDIDDFSSTIREFEGCFMVYLLKRIEKEENLNGEIFSFIGFMYAAIHVNGF